MNNNFIDRRNKSVSYEDWISQNFDIINEIIFEFINKLENDSFKYNFVFNEETLSESICFYLYLNSTSRFKNIAYM